MAMWQLSAPNLMLRVIGIPSATIPPSIPLLSGTHPMNSHQRYASPMLQRPLVLTVALLAAITSFDQPSNAVTAGDWPQILGPNRDGLAVDETVSAWENAPKIRWRTKCGAGYAGAAVSDGKVFVWHRNDKQETLDCLATDDGRSLWQANFPAIYRGGVDADRGPRCVPLVSGDQVFLYGAGGDLSAVAVSNGTTQWTRQLRTEYDADDGYFGAGSSPIIVGSTLIVAVGGNERSGLVALDTQSGKTRWTAVDQEAAYASPVAIEIEGQTRIVAVLRLQTVMIDPASGKILGEFDFGQRGPTVNAATPITRDGKLFLTASYGVGCRMLDMNSTPLKNTWNSDDVISSQYVTPVLIDQWLYAITGREDFGTGELLCVRWSDGEVAWRRPGFQTAHLMGLGNKILAQRVSGQLELFAAEPKAFRSLATMDLPAGTYRALPAFSDGTLYCRRNLSSTESELIAVELNQ